MKIIWSPLSLKRALEITQYIANDKPLAARKWIDQILNTVLQLKKFPMKGRIVPEVKRAYIREIILGNYRIIYRTDKKQITILTIRYSKQRLPLNELKK